MTDAQTKTGTVTKLAEDGNSVEVDKTWYRYSSEDKRGVPWEPPTEVGQKVTLAFRPWVNQAGKTVYYANSIKAERLPGNAREENILRSVALKAAVEFASNRDYTDINVIVTAEFFLQFLEGQQEPETEPDFPFE